MRNRLSTATGRTLIADSQRVKARVLWLHRRRVRRDQSDCRAMPNAAVALRIEQANVGVDRLEESSTVITLIQECTERLRCQRTCP